MYFVYIFSFGKFSVFWNKVRRLVFILQPYRQNAIIYYVRLQAFYVIVKIVELRMPKQQP